MSEVSKHTPGPWKAHATNLARSGVTEYEIHWSDDGECVAEVVHGAPDAHLIAAAPDLLADLKFLVDHIEENGRLAGKSERAITNFTAPYRANIAKAEGGAS